MKPLSCCHWWTNLGPRGWYTIPAKLGSCFGAGESSQKPTIVAWQDHQVRVTNTYSEEFWEVNMKD